MSKNFIRNYVVFKRSEFLKNKVTGKKLEDGKSFPLILRISPSVIPVAFMGTLDFCHHLSAVQE